MMLNSKTLGNYTQARASELSSENIQKTIVFTYSQAYVAENWIQKYKMTEEAYPTDIQDITEIETTGSRKEEIRKFFESQNSRTLIICFGGKDQWPKIEQMRELVDEQSQSLDSQNHQKRIILLACYCAADFSDNTTSISYMGIKCFAENWRILTIDNLTCEKIPWPDNLELEENEEEELTLKNLFAPRIGEAYRENSQSEYILTKLLVQSMESILQDFVVDENSQKMLRGLLKFAKENHSFRSMFRKSLHKYLQISETDESPIFQKVSQSDFIGRMCQDYESALVEYLKEKLKVPIKVILQKANSKLGIVGRVSVEVNESQEEIQEEIRD